MLRTRENSDVFNSRDEIYLVFTSKKQISSIYCTYKQEKMLHCLLWNLGHQNVLSPGHEKIRTLLCKMFYVQTPNSYAFQNYFIFTAIFNKKVQVGKDQEKAQSEKDSHSKNRGGKKPN